MSRRLSTKAIGVAVAYRRFEIAIVLCLLNLVTLLWFKEIKKVANGQDGS